jgi:transcriptional regulator with XRE-family HTH domain
MSQAALAQKMGALDGGSTNRSRVADLETGRDGMPRSASWQDVVTAAIALNVPVSEIVLPDDDTVMVVAQPTTPVEIDDDETAIVDSFEVDRAGAKRFFAGETGPVRDETAKLLQEHQILLLEVRETIQSIRTTVSPGPTVLYSPPIDDHEDS